MIFVSCILFYVFIFILQPVTYPVIQLLDTSSIMQTAQSTTHPAMSRNKCDICNRVFTRKDGLTRHHDSVHRRQGHLCTTCGNLFTRLDNLTRHCKTTHTNQTSLTDTPSATDRQIPQPLYVTDRQTMQPLAAIQTTRTMTNTIPLKRHTMYDDIANNKRVKTNNDSNVNSHTTIFPVDDLAMIRYTCDICEHAFTCKHGLKRHHDTAHRRRRHTCRECLQEFTRKYNLTNHYKIPHTIKTLPDDTSATDTNIP